MIPAIRKIGAYFRKQVGPELAGRHRCGICCEPTSPGGREWSSHLQRFVDLQCIPAIVRRRGVAAVSHWLETGDLAGGTLAEQTLVMIQTEGKDPRR